MARYKETLAGNPTRLNKSKRGEIGVKLEHVLSVNRALLVKDISLKLKDSFLIYLSQLRLCFYMASAPPRLRGGELRKISLEDTENFKKLGGAKF